MVNDVYFNISIYHLSLSALKVKREVLQVKTHGSKMKTRGLSHNNDYQLFIIS